MLNRQIYPRTCSLVANTPDKKRSTITINFNLQKYRPRYFRWQDFFSSYSTYTYVHSAVAARIQPPAATLAIEKIHIYFWLIEIGIASVCLGILLLLLFYRETVNSRPSVLLFPTFAHLQIYNIICIHTRNIALWCVLVFPFLSFFLFSFTSICILTDINYKRARRETRHDFSPTQYCNNIFLLRRSRSLFYTWKSRDANFSFPVHLFYWAAWIFVSGKLVWSRCGRISFR